MIVQTEHYKENPMAKPTDNKPRLISLIPEYYRNNKDLANRKKVVESMSNEIKALMNQMDLVELEADGIIANLTTITKTGFNEDQLLAFVKAKKIKGLVKKKEYVDMLALEDAIYHGLILGADLAPFQVFTDSQRLTMKIEKAENGTA